MAMPFDAHVLRVLIASPGDTGEERDAVQRALHGWNADRAAREEVILLPRRYETDAIPRLGGNVQGIINDQLVQDADIVIALFDSRLGMATPTDVSGTAEEIRRSHEAGKPVHVWFSEEPIPRDADLKQLGLLNKFKDTLESLGLLGTYASPDDLAYKVRQAIESDLDHLNLGAIQRRSTARDQAKLRAEYRSEREPYMDSKGRTKYKTRGEKLVVRNVGTATATALSIELRGLDEEQRPPTLWNEPAQPDLIPDSEFSWPLAGFMGTARNFIVAMTWTEGGEQRTETQHVAM
jgi:hypothetical protein